MQLPHIVTFVDPVEREDQYGTPNPELFYGPDAPRRDVRGYMQPHTSTEPAETGGPPSVPWLRLTEEGHTWRWPAVQRVVLRLTYWHRTDHDAKAAASLALAVLCALLGTHGLIDAEPIVGSIAAPDTLKPLETATVVIRIRTPARL